MPSEGERAELDDSELIEDPVRRQGQLPTVDEFGILRQNGTFVILPPSEQALAEILLRDFGSVVHDDVLEQHVLSKSESRRATLRKHASRLRKRIAPLGLAVTCFRDVGYMLHHDNTAVSILPERERGD